MDVRDLKKYTCELGKLQNLSVVLMDFSPTLCKHLLVVYNSDLSIDRSV